MRHAVRLLFALMLAPAFVSGQNPSYGLTPAQKDKRLGEILDAWESRMNKLTSLSMKVEQEVEDSVRKRKEVKTGIVNLHKPSFALLHLADPRNPNDFERFVSDGTKFYKYDPKRQVIETITFNGKDLQENLFFTLMSGIKAADAKKRFEMRYLKESESYAYVDIFPKSNADRQDFSAARLVLIIDRREQFRNMMMLPKQIHMIEPNNDIKILTFSDIVPDHKDLTPAAFAVKLPGKEWKMEAIPMSNVKDPLPGASKGPVDPSKVRSQRE